VAFPPPPSRTASSWVEINEETVPRGKGTGSCCRRPARRPPTSARRCDHGSSPLKSVPTAGRGSPLRIPISAKPPQGIRRAFIRARVAISRPTVVAKHLAGGPALNRVLVMDLHATRSRGSSHPVDNRLCEGPDPARDTLLDAQKTIKKRLGVVSFPGPWAGSLARTGHWPRRLESDLAINRSKKTVGPRRPNVRRESVKHHRARFGRPNLRESWDDIVSNTGHPVVPGATALPYRGARPVFFLFAPIGAFLQPCRYPALTLLLAFFAFPHPPPPPPPVRG